MKHHIKKIVFLSLLVFATLFSSCEKDLYEEALQETPKGKTNYVTIEDVPFLIPSVVNFNEDYKFLTSPDKTVNKEGLDLNLDLEHILEYIQANGLKTYSIAINYDIENNDNMFFENLHIYQKEGEYKTAILKYDSLEDDKKFDLNTLTGTVEVYDINKVLQSIIQMENGQKTCDKVIIGCWHLLFFSNGEILIGNGCADNSGGGGSESGSSSTNGTASNDGTNSGTGNTYGSSTGTTSNTNTNSSTSTDPTMIEHQAAIVPNEPQWLEFTNQFTMANLITQHLELDLGTRTWLRNPINLEATAEIYHYLWETLNDGDSTNDGTNSEFANEVVDLSITETSQEDVSKLINLSIIIKNSEDTFFTEEFESAIDQYIDLDLGDPLSTIQPNFISLKIYLDYRKLRQINPEWSRGKCFWYASKGIVHLSLDAFGLIPVFGEVADLINGVIYTIEGEGIDATLSYAGAIPVVGWATAGTKFGLKIATTATGVTKLAFKITNGIVEFGNSGQLRKVLNITSSALQAHHLVPWASRGKMAVQRAALHSSAFHMNEALNGIAVATWRNQPNHTAYNNLIDTRLDNFRNANQNATPQECYEFLTDLIQQIRTWVINNPNSHLNEIVLP